MPNCPKARQDNVTLNYDAPHLTLPSGQEMLVVPSVVVPPWEAGTQQLPLGTCGGALLALQSLALGQSHIWGTAFLIAPGLAVTAAHVVREYKAQGHFASGKFALMALGFSEATSQIWYVDYIYLSAESDMAILSMTFGAKLPPRLELTPFEISAIMPAIGDTVTTMGFASGEIFALTDLDAGKIGDCSSSLLVSVGPVIEVYPTGRDRIMAPRACFAAEVETVGAMSGGPVCNSAGRVVGFISSSIDPRDEFPGITFFSMIYDALLTVVRPTWPPGYWPTNGGLLKDIVEVEDGWRANQDIERGIWRYLADSDETQGKT